MIGDCEIKCDNGSRNWKLSGARLSSFVITKIMNLQRALEQKKSSLKATSTRVYSSCGDVHIEIRNPDGNFTTIKVDEQNPGYVLDTKPDLSVSVIFPWLMLGSQDVAYDHHLLKSHQISHILSLGVPAPHYEDIKVTFKEAYDLEDFNMLNLFEECCQLIDSIRKKDGVLYIHCNAGVSRSATVVIAYLIKSQKLNYEEAYKIVKSKRSKICPNRGFQLQLKEFAEIILSS